MQPINYRLFLYCNLRFLYCQLLELFFQITYNRSRISYTGREKLKLTAVISRIVAVVFILCAFNLSITALFAQEGSLGEETAVEESPVVDPITAREQALSLGDNGAGAAASPPAASVWGIFRVILTLAVVAAAIYGMVFFIKRSARGGRGQDPFLKILASAPLGANRGAYIIAVGSKAWLVGAAESGVSLISEIEDKDVLNAMFLEDSRKSAEAPAGRFPDFKSLLQRLGMPMESGAPPGPEDIRKRRERLKGL